MTNNFTKEEIETAKAVRSQMMEEDAPPDLKCIYMAGEICMWDELQSLPAAAPDTSINAHRAIGASCQKCRNFICTCEAEKAKLDALSNKIDYINKHGLPYPELPELLSTGKQAHDSDAVEKWDDLLQEFYKSDFCIKNIPSELIDFIVEKNNKNC